MLAASLWLDQQNYFKRVGEFLTKGKEGSLQKQKTEILFNEFFKFSKNYITIGTDKSMQLGGRSGSNFNEEKLKQALENPERYSENLIDFSEYLYTASPTYNKIINFYATLPTYSYVVDASENLEGANPKEVKEDYFEVLERLEKMSLRHELQKLMKTAWKEDIFYGYEMETNNAYYILKMDRKLCRISSVQDGVYNYEFNMSVFDGNQELFSNYPKEFEHKYYKLYLQRKEGKDKIQEPEWVELPARQAFAIKINEDLIYPLPPFSSSMESALDEDVYTKIKKNKDALDNFMALVQHIPLNDDEQSLDTFRINLQTAMQFHSQAESVLPEGVGLITSPMKIEAVKLEKSKREDDLIMNAKDNTLSNAGLPPNIFSTTNKTAGGMKYAIRYLEQISFAPLRQLERWINRKLKFMNVKNKFKIRFLDITVFSNQDVFEDNLKAAQFGYATKQEVASALGQSPLNFINKLKLENDILGLQDNMIPLTSTHTQSKNDPNNKQTNKKDDNEIEESTEVWRENNPDA